MKWGGSVMDTVTKVGSRIEIKLKSSVFFVKKENKLFFCKFTLYRNQHAEYKT